MIVKCTNCGAEHPEFHTKCPKCHYSKNDIIAKELTVKKSDNTGINIFDFSFNSFIMPHYLKLLYFIVVIFGAFLLLLGELQISQLSFIPQGQKIFFYISAFFTYFFYVIGTRLICELFLLLFKIEKNTRK